MSYGNGITRLPTRNPQQFKKVQVQNIVTDLSPDSISSTNSQSKPHENRALVGRRLSKTPNVQKYKQQSRTNEFVRKFEKLEQLGKGTYGEVFKAKNRFTNQFVAVKQLKMESENWYRSPELLLGERNYTQAIDIWSVGCIFGEILNGGVPLFQGDNDLDQLNKIFQVCGTPTNLSWKDCVKLPNWKNMTPQKIYQNNLSKIFSEKCSPLMFDLLKKMLEIDPKKRESAIELSKHPWFLEVKVDKITGFNLKEATPPHNLPIQSCNELSTSGGNFSFRRQNRYHNRSNKRRYNSAFGNNQRGGENKRRKFHHYQNYDEFRGNRGRGRGGNRGGFRRYPNPSRNNFQRPRVYNNRYNNRRGQHRPYYDERDNRRNSNHQFYSRNKSDSPQNPHNNQQNRNHNQQNRMNHNNQNRNRKY